MIDGWVFGLTLAAAIGAGLSAGVFFAFSTFIMKALGRLPAAQGLAAMQAINWAAPAPLFMLALFGTGALCVPLGIWAITELDETAAVYVLIGGALYLVGIVLTIGYHIPRNVALDGVDADSAGAADAWAGYHRAWTAWNHVRTLTSLVASALFILALRAG
jgi:uncharacterized membrane protein